MTERAKQIRFAIPSKGRMQSSVMEFFDKCGLTIKRNSRDYLASLKGFSDVQVVLQRQKDIVRGVDQGLLTFGIVGYDLSQEIPPNQNNIVIMHEGLGFGKCSLEVAVPEDWQVGSLDDLKAKQETFGTYHVATGFPQLTQQFFEEQEIDYQFVEGAGTLEVSPALGNSDIIVDLVSTGRTLAANRLKQIDGGLIIKSQGVVIANRDALRDETTLRTARRLLEYIEATLRADHYMSVHANMRGEDAEAKVHELFGRKGLEGLNGPTVSKVVNKEQGDWFAIHIIVDKSVLMEAIESLREVGGSGVVVTPTKYIFEEEIDAYQRLLNKLDP